MSLKTTLFSTVLGSIRLYASEHFLEGVYFETALPKDVTASEGTTPILLAAQREITDYLSGNRRTFSVSYRLTSGTLFQNKVWLSLANIPYGATWSYKEQASFIGAPSAIRAVGRANGANPLCIVLPCHRVVGSSGRLTGYAGGLPIKEHLLRLESSIAAC